MAIGNETFNHELYSLLKVRGYQPSPLNSQNQRVKASQEADVIEFDFIKDGENYGKVWVSIDDASNVCIYFDDEQADSPSNATPGTDYDDTWTGLLKHIKQWAQRRQLSFELANKDRLGDDMRQRDYYKMKEKLGEGYHPMGKKASYNDAVPNVKIILQHNRGLEEGEQRYRNVAKIFLENQDGERFLAPTTRPGIARVYARHIAEGGVPNDERWNHIKSICEEYNKMAGFVRATRNKEFNESALSLVQEGANHYSNLRETLNKLAGHRGYHTYFESYTPPLMEDEDDTTINELFVQETMDPRIESVMPILSRLHKKVSETAVPEVDSLAEWADSVINEKLDMDDKKKDKKPAKKKEQEKDEDSEEKSTGSGPLSRIKTRAEKKMSGKMAKFLGIQEGDMFSDEDDLKPFNKIASINRGAEDNEDWDDDSWIPDEEDFEHEEMAKELSRHRGRFAANDIDENFISMAPQAVAEKEMDSTTKSLAVPADKMLEAPGAETLSHNQSTEKSNLKAFDLEEEVEEGLDANQKRVGQLGPTEKVKNNNIGKLVGANEAMNYEDDNEIDEGILDTIKSRVKSFIGKPTEPAAPASATEPKKAPGIPAKTQNSSGLNDYIKKIAADLNAADPKTKISLVKELVGIMADRKGHPEWDNVIGSVKGILKRAGVNPNVAAAANAKLQAGQTFESAMQEAINLLLESTGLTMKILNESEDLLDIRRLAGL